MDEDSTLWQELLHGITWKELFAQYAEALNELFGYIRQHPNAKHADERVAAAMQTVVDVNQEVVGYARNREVQQSPPQVELVKTVLAIASQVRRAIPEPTMQGKDAA